MKPTIKETTKTLPTGKDTSKWKVESSKPDMKSDAKMMKGKKAC